MSVVEQHDRRRRPASRLHRRLPRRATPARRPPPLLVGRDPRGPRLLRRLLGDPEPAPRQSRTRRSDHAREHHPLAAVASASTTSRRSRTGRCSSRPLIIAANYFYGSLHFIVTGGVMIYLFRKWTRRLPALAQHARHRHRARAHRLRVLPADAAAPARRLCTATRSSSRLRLRRHAREGPAFWSFNSGAVSKISNQFAAMPSVHCAWALWCACALVPRLRHTWAKVLAVVYPVTTVTVIVVTANHYFLDAVGGLPRPRRRLRRRAHLHPRRPRPGDRARRPMPAAGDCGQSSSGEPARWPRRTKPDREPDRAPRSRSRAISGAAPCRRRSRRPPRGC